MKTGPTKRFVLAVLSLAAVAMALVPASMASASSRVNIGGTATCRWLGGGGLRAVSVTVSFGGASSTVGTSAVPFRTGRYDTTLPSLPRGGANVRFDVTCSGLSNRPGTHTFYRWLKPDWRNTTGNTNFFIP